ncbi:hypothetical protein N7G274_010167 [Stereocaulon virgatum]|uniref:Uncharacterized protein n=1 Tax=Stereocaulon virgatum TaxID=373712 RepID=A0ABR3ZU04_9LECA
MAPLKLTLPLADFEKRLLCDFVKTFGGQFEGQFIDNSTIVTGVFNRWSWADEVIRSFRPTHPSDELFISHGGDRSLLWESCLSRLSLVRRHDDGPKYSRVEDLRKNNTNYPQEFMTDYDGDILVESLAEDNHFWRIIANVFLGVRYNISSFSTIRNFSDIYQRRGWEPVEFEHMFFAPNGDVRSVALLYLGLGDVPNSIEMSAAVRRSESEFPSAGEGRNMQTVHSADKLLQRRKDWEEDQCDIWSLLRKAAMIERGGRQGDKVWAALDECRFVELYEDMVVASVCGDMVVQDQLRLPQWKFFSSINDPSTHVEFIPWDNLVFASPSHETNWLDYEIDFCFQFSWGLVLVGVPPASASPPPAAGEARGRAGLLAGLTAHLCSSGFPSLHLQLLRAFEL